MKDFSTSWKASKKPNKQRKYAMNAPLHLRKAFVSVHLAKPLREKYKIRAIPVKKGDSVKILRGQFKKKTGKVNRVDLKATKIFIDGIDATKKDGSKVPYPMNPSNLMLQDLDLEDKIRKAKVERNIK